MDTSESQSPSIEPGFTSPVVETMAPEPARWSVRARRWQIIALAIGVIAAAIGALWFWGPTSFYSIDDLLKLFLGLILMPLGGSLAYLAVRTQRAAPDQLYQLRPTNRPRNLFVLVWIMGMIASLALQVRSIGDVKPSILVGMILAVTLVASGGMWAYRWFANKLQDEWPTGRLSTPPAVPLRWPRSWAISWAGMSGVLSAILAVGSEIFLLWLAARLLGPMLADVFESASLARDSTGSMLRQPIILIILFAGAVIVAPLTEEACKAIGLRLMRGAIQRPLDGLMMGMAAGMGFGLVESALYLGVLGSPWLINGWARLITLLLHGVATSVIGVAYARSLRSGRRGDVLAGYGRAVLLHGVWNAVAVGIILGFAVSEWLILGLACVIVLLLLMGRLIPRTVMAGVQTVVQEGHEQANEPLPPEWSPTDYGLGWRLMGSRPIIVHGAYPPRAP